MQETLFSLGSQETPARSGVRHRNSRVAPLLKWPGGKTGELDAILGALPQSIDRFYEPFVGGGAVYWALPPLTRSLINDLSDELVLLYRLLQNDCSVLRTHLDELAVWWHALQRHGEQRASTIADQFVAHRSSKEQSWIYPACSRFLDGLGSSVPPTWSDLRSSFEREAAASVPKKVARMLKVELQRAAELPYKDLLANLEGALKAACYTTLRTAYNRGRLDRSSSARQAALFFFMREYAYAAMFRFNASGAFNVPYGGISYNRKNLTPKISHMYSTEVLERLSVTTIECLDFVAFLEAHPPQSGDFMFLDPPYDSDFSDYDLNSFGRKDHERLAEVMRQAPCAFQLVIKATPAVEKIYSDSAWQTLVFDKTYMWTIKERNDRTATHLIITNYET